MSAKKCPLAKSKYTECRSWVWSDEYFTGDVNIKPQEVEVVEFQDCIGERCDWWSKGGQCVVFEIADSLDTLVLRG